MDATTQTNDTKAHRIVIVGGGAGGLELAVRLGNKLGRHGRAQVILVDSSLIHVWKPLLHEVAAGTLDSHEDAIEFLAQARRHFFRFSLGRMVGLDRAGKRIHLAAITNQQGFEVAPPRELGYDTLIIAIGGQVNDFIICARSSSTPRSSKAGSGSVSSAPAPPASSWPPSYTRPASNSSAWD